MSENLWPEDFGTVEVRTPVSILREQALALGQRTNNVVIGRVSTTPGGNDLIRHQLILHCPALGYSVELLSVIHKIALYPADIFLNSVAGSTPVANAYELIEALKLVFASKNTKAIIASLMAQSRG